MEENIVNEQEDLIWRKTKLSNGIASETGKAVVQRLLDVMHKGSFDKNLFKGMMWKGMKCEVSAQREGERIVALYGFQKIFLKKCVKDTSASVDVHGPCFQGPMKPVLPSCGPNLVIFLPKMWVGWVVREKRMQWGNEFSTSVLCGVGEVDAERKRRWALQGGERGKSKHVVSF